METYRFVLYICNGFILGPTHRNVGRTAQTHAFEVNFRVLLILRSSCWEPRKFLKTAAPLPLPWDDSFVYDAGDSVEHIVLSDGALEFITSGTTYYRHRISLQYNAIFVV